MMDLLRQLWEAPAEYGLTVGELIGSRDENDDLRQRIELALSEQIERPAPAAVVSVQDCVAAGYTAPCGICPACNPNIIYSSQTLELSHD